MDLGLTGRTAIVCASSHGLGRACAAALAAAGCTLILNGRDAAALEDAAAALRHDGATVRTVAGDVADEQVQQALIDAAQGKVDILVNNNGGPPLRDFRALDAEAIHAGVDANMVTPIRLVQKVIDGMIERRFGRIVCITSGSVKAPVPGLDLSSGARVGLTGFLAGVARQVAHANVTINFLLPGLFETRRLAGVHAFNAKARDISVEDAAAQARERIPARRFGDPAEFGDACAFLCAASSGFITGQSLLIDGGAYPGVL
ncbi:3-oxoacyl-[acyl-carrier protein] reductase [Sphingomonas sp. BE138]|uniref:SDR family oxidoreductase n=1 Tax=Sphingomonas sp. BE138 TaxID=2817845 RepID=UPI00285E1264|nr:SDR family oxidoreductase [Sphingomonas sp. BE138]MDR6789959.1 3-oxoacyl-[acyl-carrier protein] reductase [Sphingomonas sp. BE138]